MIEHEREGRFYALIWPHAAALTRAARILIHDPGAADDIVQESLLKAFRSLSQLEEGTDPLAWLMTILRNTRVDYLRHRARHAAGEVSLDQMVVEPDAAASPEGQQNTLDQWEKPEELLELLSDQSLINQLKRLPEEMRWTLLLVDVQGLDHEAAARVLDVPPGTVKSRAHRARAILKERLAPLMRELRPSRP